MRFMESCLAVPWLLLRGYFSGIVMVEKLSPFVKSLQDMQHEIRRKRFALGLASRIVEQLDAIEYEADHQTTIQQDNEAGTNYIIGEIAKTIMEFEG